MVFHWSDKTACDFIKYYTVTIRIQYSSILQQFYSDDVQDRLQASILTNPSDTVIKYNWLALSVKLVQSCCQNTQRKFEDRN